jgi:hypothetical protein
MALWQSEGGGQFFIREVPLYMQVLQHRAWLLMSKVPLYGGGGAHTGTCWGSSC